MINKNGRKSLFIQSFHKLRRKMSKTLGNSPDPLVLMEQYGADGVRMGMLLSSPAGNDLLFDEALCEQGRNFSNKMWNAFRLVKGWQVDPTLAQPLHSATAVKWFRHRFNEVLGEINSHFDKFRISDALMTAYKLVWDDFCSYFLEIVKPAYQQPIDGQTYEDIITIFEQLMQLLHPFMPFITEELWHGLRERGESESIMVTLLPEYDEAMAHTDILTRFANTQKVIEAARRVRNDKNIAQKVPIQLLVLKQNKVDEEMDSIIVKLCNVSEIQYIAEKVPGTCSFIENNVEYLIPVASNINVEEELKKLNADLEYMEKFLKSVMGKLSNERFVNNAPEAVVNTERKKKADAEEKIRILKEQIANLK